MSDIRDELTRTLFFERESEVKHPTFEREMGLYNLIGAGKIDQIEEYQKDKPSSNAKERGVLSEDPIRNTMYHFVAMITMISRVCINYGLEQDIAYKMSDIFINKADRMKNIDDIMRVQDEMIHQYAKTMAEINKVRVHSKQIVLCLDYISANLHDNVSVTELADYVKLNETYLSKLFKKEMGLSISEYIRNKKVEEAKSLLRYSDKTSIEIATDLGFSSHSYFISVFKKVTNMTPKEYRNKHFRTI